MTEAWAEPGAVVGDQEGKEAGTEMNGLLYSP